MALIRMRISCCLAFFVRVLKFEYIIAIMVPASI